MRSFLRLLMRICFQTVYLLRPPQKSTKSAPLSGITANDNEKPASLCCTANEIVQNLVGCRVTVERITL